MSTLGFLLAQTTTANDSQWLRVALYILGAVALIVGPIVLAHLIASALRAKDLQRRLAVVLFTAFAATAVVALRWHPKLGVDLRGGVILVYGVDLEASAAGAANRDSAEGEQLDADDPDRRGSDIDMQALVQAVSRRINPDGLKEIVVRPFGANQIEIVIPQAEGAEIDELKQKIATAGVLLFRIVANPTDHSDVIAMAQAQSEQPLMKLAHEIRNAEGRIVARWTPVDREVAPENRRDDPDYIRPLKVDISRDTIRDGRTGELLVDIPSSAHNSEANPQAFEEWLAQQGIDSVEVLMVEPEEEVLDVRGDFLGSVRSDYDPTTNRPCVSFTMRGKGIARMAALTNMNRPDPATGFHRRLGIVLDNKLLSAPQIQSPISDRGQITGQFTVDEVRFLVGILQAGKLPAVLHKEPISQNQIGPLLGLQTIWQGSISIGISLVFVLVFVLFYYRWAGMVACLALILNLLMTYALMILLGASLTLPGLAGLVLTVGMSVDANVLIYERIREEIRRGATLRMAIRNGFSRATTTIIDSNLTTLITGVVLYAIGTDQVRGFAVTLILGILMCMYTSIYFSRLLFDLAERRRWIKSLRMMQMIGETNIDFLKLRWPAAVFSLVLIVAGLIAALERGSRLLDIDFSGGSSVVMELEQPLSDEQVREKLAESFQGISVDGVSAQYTLNQMRIDQKKPNTIWKVDSSLTDVKQLQAVLEKEFQLVTYHMNFTRPEEISFREAAPASGGEAGTSSTGAAGTDAEAADESTQPEGSPTNDQGAADGASTEDQPSAEADDANSPSTPEPSTTEPSTTEREVPEEAAEAPAPQSGDDAVNEETSNEDAAAEEAGAEDVDNDGGTEPTDPSGCGQAPDTEAVDQEQDQPSAEDDAEPAEGTPSGDVATEGTDEQPANTQPATNADDAQEPATGKEPAGDAANTESPDSERTGNTSAETSSAETSSAETSSAETTTGTTANSGRAARVGSKVTATFSSPVSRTTLEDLIQATARELNLGFVSVQAAPTQIDQSGSGTSSEWELTLGTSAAEANQILQGVQKKIDATPAWVQASIIGGQVAGDTREKAIAAMLASFLGIVAYLWFRFHRIEFGLAAVLAVVHDAIVAIAFLAFSHYFVAAFGHVPGLGIEEFKISLPVVAAILTLIGYSLNDTIVIFDRLREIRGKSPELTAKMINDSVNQTLSRTLLTAGTTLIVVLILYFVGGEGIHGFAFTLLIGLIAGTYSTVFIASPALLWMLQRDKSESVRTNTGGRS